MTGPTDALNADERLVQPEFTGTAAEYFRIWIVNLFFTLATLGIYSAWAKVRKRRYFYGSTRLDGDSFDCLGSRKAILNGLIIAVAIFAIYALAGELYPQSRYAFWAVGVLAFPWLVVRALAFNSRNSAYRGLRFNFEATTKQAARVYIGMLAVVILTAGLAFPWFMARQKAFVVSLHAFRPQAHAAVLRQRDRHRLLRRTADSLGRHPQLALPSRELLDDRRGKPGAPHESVARAGRREQPGAGRLLQRGRGRMSVIEAGYFDGKSSVKRPVGIVVSRGRMKIIGRDLEQEFDARLVRRALR